MATPSGSVPDAGSSRKSSVGIAQRRLRDADALQHAARVGPQLLAERGAVEADAVGRGLDLGAGVRRIAAAEAPVEREERRAREVPVEAEPLGHVSRAGADPEVVDRASVDREASRSRAAETRAGRRAASSCRRRWGRSGRASRRGAPRATRRRARGSSGRTGRRSSTRFRRRSRRGMIPGPSFREYGLFFRAFPSAVFHDDRSSKPLQAVSHASRRGRRHVLGQAGRDRRLPRTQRRGQDDDDARADGFPAADVRHRRGSPDTTSWRSRAKARAAIGYLPESAATYPEMRVARVPVVPRAPRRRSGPRPCAGASPRRSDQCLLGEVADRKIENLSKGFRQRTALAGRARPPAAGARSSTSRRSASTRCRSSRSARRSARSAATAPCCSRRTSCRRSRRSATAC